MAVAAVAVAVVEQGSPRAQRAEEEAPEPGRDGALVGTPVMEVQHEDRHDHRHGRQRHHDRQVNTCTGRKL